MNGISTARTMLHPEKIREFKADVETIRSRRATAMQHLHHKEQLAQAEKGAAETALAAVECGRALKRVYDSKSWEDSFTSWSDFLRDLNIPRVKSYHLMACAEAFDGVPIETIENIQQPLGQRRLAILAEAEPEEREEVLEHAASASPVETDAAFARLKQKLTAAPAPVKFEEPEAPKQSQRENDFAWATRQATTWQNWFDRHGLGERARPMLAELLQLAGAAVQA